MRKKKLDRLVALVKQTSPEVILRVAGRCDGHTIFKPEAFVQDGLPAAVVEHLTRTYQSDGSPKGTIFVDGQPVNELCGVYGLDLLEFLAAALGVEYRRRMGRGFQAQAIQQALRQHFQQEAPQTSA